MFQIDMDCKLLNDLCRIMDKEAAVILLLSTYNNYPSQLQHMWNWNKGVVGAFMWRHTEQGHSYWKSISNQIKSHKQEVV